MQFDSESNTTSSEDYSESDFTESSFPVEEIILSNVSTLQFPLSCMEKNYGVYRVVVEDITEEHSGAVGMFDIVRSNTDRNGEVLSIMSAGDENQKVNLDWPANSFPRIYHSPAGRTERENVYLIKVINY